jgi:hypothetical protein
METTINKRLDVYAAVFICAMQRSKTLGACVLRQIQRGRLKRWHTMRGALPRSLVATSYQRLRTEIFHLLQLICEGPTRNEG